MNTPAERGTIEQLAEPVVPIPARTFARMLDRILDAAATRAPSPTVERLKQLSAKGLTPIGEHGLYGIYAGIARGAGAGNTHQAPAGDYILEVLDQGPQAMTWGDAMEWAKGTGGTLPTRKEQALLFANVPELFKAEAYWSCEQHESATGSAWYQYFDHGYQNYWFKSNELRARAVRRLSIK